MNNHAKYEDLEREKIELEVLKLAQETRPIWRQPKFALASLATAVAVVGTFLQGSLFLVKSQKAELGVERATLDLRETEAKRERLQSELEELGRSYEKQQRELLAVEARVSLASAALSDSLSPGRSHEKPSFAAMRFVYEQLKADASEEAQRLVSQLDRISVEDYWGGARACLPI